MQAFPCVIARKWLERAGLWWRDYEELLRLARRKLQKDQDIREIKINNMIKSAKFFWKMLYKSVFSLNRSYL
jgi:hypothetical protein